MIGAYILIVLGVVVWAALLPTGKRLPEGVMRGITAFGGAFLLGVCCLDMLPEIAEHYCCYTADGAVFQSLNIAIMPFLAILAGFLIQQMLDGISAHAEHGHTEGNFTLGGLMLGLSLHAFLEGMPLVSQSFAVDRGLLWGIVIHNIPVALILVALMSDRGYTVGKMLLMLVIFGLMSPLGSLLKVFVLQPNYVWQHCIVGMVVGVLLHVSSSILFDHKRNHFSWLNIGLMAVAFIAVGIITH